MSRATLYWIEHYDYTKTPVSREYLLPMRCDNCHRCLGWGGSSPEGHSLICNRCASTVYADVERREHVDG